jgi:hypothetical protein
VLEAIERGIYVVHQCSLGRVRRHRVTLVYVDKIHLFSEIVPCPSNPGQWGARKSELAPISVSLTE